MRLIDADALRKYFEVPHELKCGIQAGMDEYALKCIDEQLTVTASPWHRVEEEMPDLLQFVVVCNDEGKCVVAQYVGYQTDSLTPWRIAYTMYDTDIYDEKECGPVRFWMPLPSPPVNKMFTK